MSEAVAAEVRSPGFSRFFASVAPGGRVELSLTFPEKNRVNPGLRTTAGTPYMS